MISGCDKDTKKETHVCEKESIDLYIMSGQSNMVGYSPVSDLDLEDQNKVYENGYYYVTGEGERWQLRNFNVWKDTLKAGMYGCTSDFFGPEVGFSKFMEDKYPVVDGKRKLAIFKYSQGGSALANRWFSSTIYEKGNGEQIPRDLGNTSLPNCELDGNVVGDLYYNLITRVREQIMYLSENYCVHIKGLIWNQGCQDGVDNNAFLYEQNLTDFINDVRRDLNIPDLPVVIGQILQLPTDGGCPYSSVVREAQKNVAEAMNNVDIVITDLYLPVEYGNPHFSSASMLKLGYEEARLIYALAFPEL